LETKGHHYRTRFSIGVRSVVDTPFFTRSVGQQRPQRWSDKIPRQWRETQPAFTARATNPCLTLERLNLKHIPPGPPDMACSSPTVHGWSDNIKRLFTQRSDSLSNCNSKGGTRILHPAGTIWRSVLAQSIFSDLALAVGGGKRFLPLHHLGLTGVILYELPGPDTSSHMDHGNGHKFTLVEVFGDPDDPLDLGMETDELLDRVQARLIYFPAYSCTSFVVSCSST
jgi:hypothetical protein